MYNFLFATVVDSSRLSWQSSPIVCEQAKKARYTIPIAKHFHVIIDLYKRKIAGPEIGMSANVLESQQYVRCAYTQIDPNWTSFAIVNFASFQWDRNYSAPVWFLFRLHAINVDM